MSEAMYLSCIPPAKQDSGLDCCQAGFSVLELIMVLMLAGIIAAIGGLGVTQFAESFVFGKKNAATSGKAQLTMLRLIKEFTVITAVTSGSASSITFTAFHDGGVAQDYTISTSGSNLLLDDGVSIDILTDQVSSFTLTYYDTYNGAGSSAWSGSTRIIEANLILTGADGITASFVTRVRPRNL